MKRLLLGALIFCSYQFALAQVRFEKGYFIDNSGSRKECFIKNTGKINNPSSFKYKLYEDSEVFSASVEDVREFGLNDGYKYVSNKVKIDISSDVLEKMSESIEPEFGERHLFLEVLVEGKADLFLYKDPSFVRYFYSLDGSKPQQLIYKQFRNANDKTIENKSYIHQLMDKLNNDCFSLNDITGLKYDKKDLVDFFVRYSECNNVEAIILGKREEKFLVNLTLRPGIRYASLNAINGVMSAPQDVEYGSKITSRFGVEIELVLPVLKNKWSIIAEPCYQYYNSTKHFSAPSLPEKEFISTVRFESIELPVGIRHYFFLTDKSTVFVNASYYFDFLFNPYMESHRLNGDELHQPIELFTMLRNYGFGIGYKHGARYSLEFRCQTDRSILATRNDWTSEYNQISAIFGYSIF